MLVDSAMPNQRVKLAKYLSLIFFLYAGFASAEMMLGEWLKINEPKAINYLSSLSAADKGMAQKGIVFSDGSKEFEGYKFIGKVRSSVSGVHISTFLDSKNEPVAFVWVEKTGKAYPLPDCTGNDPRYKLPGWSGADLAGEVYTYSDVQPGGVVKTRCVPQSWLK